MMICIGTEISCNEPCPIRALLLTLLISVQGSIYLPLTVQVGRIVLVLQRFLHLSLQPVRGEF